MLATQTFRCETQLLMTTGVGSLLWDLASQLAVLKFMSGHILQANKCLAALCGFSGGAPATSLGQTSFGLRVCAGHLATLSWWLGLEVWGFERWLLYRVHWKPHPLASKPHNQLGEAEEVSRTRLGPERDFGCFSTLCVNPCVGLGVILFRWCVSKVCFGKIEHASCDSCAFTVERPNSCQVQSAEAKLREGHRVQGQRRHA